MTFYLRYYDGYAGQEKLSNEFLEFEFNSDGKLIYSNHKNDKVIRKVAHVSATVIDELKRIIQHSNIIMEGDSLWPPADTIERQELEIVLEEEHLLLIATRISLNDVCNSRDPEALRCFYYLVEDLKCLVFSLIYLNFRIKHL